MSFAKGLVVNWIFSGHSQGYVAEVHFSFNFMTIFCGTWKTAYKWERESLEVKLLWKIVELLYGRLKIHLLGTGGLVDNYKMGKKSKRRMKQHLSQWCTVWQIWQYVVTWDYGPKGICMFCLQVYLTVKCGNHRTVANFAPKPTCFPQVSHEGVQNKIISTVIRTTL